MSETALSANGSPATTAPSNGHLWFLIIAGVMLLASFFISAWVGVADVRGNPGIRPAEIWINEGTSHLAIFLLLPLFPLLIRYAQRNLASPFRLAAGVTASLVAFFGLHLAMMMIFRSILHPTALGADYGVNLFAPARLAYEFPKDFFTFATLAIAAGAIIEFRRASARLRAQAVKDREDWRIVLRSGGSVRYARPDEIISATAAGNYVEVRLTNGTFLARASIREIQNAAAGKSDRILRTHRSHLVNIDKVTSFEPVGDGRMRILLEDGTTIPCSRTYRAAFETVASQRQTAS